ncbi:MAG: hypothetical protein U0L04_12210, partial [Bacteroidaceae bacterium]|nr:hypothetical protein [Bacteroidaceae bacterium]
MNFGLALPKFRKDFLLLLGEKAIDDWALKGLLWAVLPKAPRVLELKGLLWAVLPKGLWVFVKGLVSPKYPPLKG